MTKPGLPKLIRTYIKHVAVGFAASAVFVGLLLGYNVGNLGHLVLSSGEGWLAVFLLWFFNGLVFAGVQFGVSIMCMSDDDDDGHTGGPGGGPRHDEGELAHVRVAQEPRRKI